MQEPFDLVGYLKNPLCPKCGCPSNKSGMKVKRGGKVQRFQCVECGHIFTP